MQRFEEEEGDKLPKPPPPKPPKVLDSGILTAYDQGVPAILSSYSIIPFMLASKFDQKLRRTSSKLLRTRVGPGT